MWSQKLETCSRKVLQFNIHINISVYKCFLKLPPRVNFVILCGCQKKLEARNYSNFTVTFSTIWRCVSDFFKFYRNLIWQPPISFIFLSAKKTNILLARDDYDDMEAFTWHLVHTVDPWFVQIGCCYIIGVS